MDVLIQFPIYVKIQKATREAQSTSGSCSDDSLMVGVHGKEERKQHSESGATNLELQNQLQSLEVQCQR